ncbi:MAG: AMP-binding protein [Deltaproteobacteria bacterium]|nr:AMP-binding protein [Deltaproteobacteria bacterium]
MQVRLAKDGEILIKGPVVMRGYFKRPDETREVLDAEGWLATGDIGAFSRDGFLRVTDRKKDLIKTAGGKYIAPQPIEARLKTHPLIADVVLYGDRRRYLTALITLNREALARYISQVDPAAADARVFVTDPRVRELVQSIVEATNKELASFETIKRFALLDHDFTLDSGELTPTLKVKRQVAYERYREEIEAMYRE